MGILKNKRKKAAERKAEYDKAHPQLAAETNYLGEVKTSMDGLPTKGKTDEEKNTAIKTATDKRKEQTEKFIAEQFPGFEVVGHVNVTRHGKSGWWEKGAGLSVNAALAKKQITGLKKAETNKFTHHLLHAPGKTLTVIASTLLRAKNTASLIIPADSKTVKVSTDQRLTEHGRWASTAAYTQTAGKWKPWWVFASIFTPLTLRNRTRESKAVDQDLLAIRRNKGGDTSTELHGGYINEADHLEKKLNELKEPPVPNSQEKQKSVAPTISEQKEQDVSTLSAENKVASINNSIVNHVSSNNPNKGDLWLFGHGGTFKKFFHAMFGIEYDFDYLTTKEIYVLKGPDGKLVYFSPPGAVKVGVDGEMTGLTTDHNGVQDRALVSATFDRSELIIHCSKQLKEEVEELKREIKTAQEKENSPENSAALEKKIDAIQAKIEVVEKHIEICDQEFRKSEKTNTPDYFGAAENVASVKRGLMKMRTGLTEGVEQKPQLRP